MAGCRKLVDTVDFLWKKINGGVMKLVAHAGLKIPWAVMPVSVRVRPPLPRHLVVLLQINKGGFGFPTSVKIGGMSSSLTTKCL